MQRALVYGGRRFNGRAAVFTKLDRIHEVTPITLIIHGACPNSRNDQTGAVIYSADMLAEEWAQAREIPYVGWPAKWRTGSLGNAAGPARNQTMLDATKPTLGVEFPGGNGTKDMRERLNKAHIPIDRS